MTSKQTIASHLALLSVFLGMGAHVLGFVTDFWCVGSRDKGLADRDGYNDDNMTGKPLSYFPISQSRVSFIPRGTYT